MDIEKSREILRILRVFNPWWESSKIENVEPFKRLDFYAIKKRLNDTEIVTLVGARQVGKTTLVKEIARSLGESAYFNCDEPDIALALSHKTSSELAEFLGPKKLAIIDEAQRVENIGLTLKLLVDTYPDRQIIATGSSSFDLANKISEPLTGRKRIFHLFPFSMTELANVSSKLEENRLLERRLIYGLYPEVIFPKDNSEKTLREITGSYLYKDIFQLEEIRNRDIILDLLRALALQIGAEVSYNELSKLLQIDKKTVARYISLLEKAFVVFQVRPWHKNKRTEIGKLRKIYFYDNVGNHQIKVRQKRRTGYPFLANIQQTENRLLPGKKRADYSPGIQMVNKQKNQGSFNLHQALPPSNFLYN